MNSKNSYLRKIGYVGIGVMLTLSFVLFTNAGFVIQTNITSGIQYMKKIVLVGADGTTTGVILDGNGPSFFSGKVGIGTSSPTTKLDVNQGDINIYSGKLIVTGLNSSYVNVNPASIAFNRDAPVYLNNTNTGSNASISINIGASPTHMLFLQSGGNVGIGTAIPGYKVDIYNDSDNSLRVTSNTSWAALRIKGADTTEYALMANYPSAGDFTIREAGAADRLTIKKTSGNVGIGTTTPQALLDLASTNTSAERIRLSGREFYDSGFTSTGGVSLLLGVNRDFNNRQLWIGNSSYLARNSTNTILRFSNFGTGIIPRIDAIATDGETPKTLGLGTNGAVSITSSGNVGIGTTSPSSRLEVQEADGSKRAISSFGNTNRDRRLEIIQDIAGDPTSYIGLNARENASSNGRDFVLQTAGTERMRIKYTDGNVGIGTSSPGSKLHVDSSSTTTFRVSGQTNGLGLNITANGSAGHTYIDNTKDDGTYNLYFRMRTDGTPVNVLSLLGNGTVGINNTSPSYTLDVNGSVRGTSWTNSDQRYKKNIETMINPLDKLLQLRGVTFDFKTNEFPQKNFNTGTQIGVIAQEVEKIYPELVSTDKEGYKSVSYANFTPILIEAIKIQQQQIENQKQDIALLKQQVLQLQNR